MDLYLIRHPAVAIATGLCYGSSDVALQETPDVGAAVIARKLTALTRLSTPNGASDASPADWPSNTPSRLPAHFCMASSPLSRCLTVANVLADTPCVDSRLAELDFGRWEGIAWDVIPREEIDAWAADITDARPHGGESVQMLANRTASWLAACEASAATAPERPHIAMTHAGVIRIMTAQALRLPLLTCLNWPIDMTGVCHLTRTHAQSAWTLAHWNN